MPAHVSVACVPWTLVILAACGGSDLMLPGPGGPGDLVVVSGDGHWIGVIADARRAVLFRLQ